MKKIVFFAIGAAMALGANAQTFKFMSDGHELENNERVNLTDKYSFDEGVLIFDPKLTFENSADGECTLSVTFNSNECGPELNGEDENFNYEFGIGIPTVQVCSETFSGVCLMVKPGDTIDRNAVMPAGHVENLLTELSYMVGSSEKNLDNLNIKAEFTVTVGQGAEKKTAVFFVDTDTAGVSEIVIDENQPVEYYDLQGRKVADPAKGIYIMRQGANAVKVIK